MKGVQIKDVLAKLEFDSTITVNGWVRNKRGSKNVTFITLNDGSTQKNLQVVAEVSDLDPKKFEQITTGAAIAVTGKIVESKGSGQNVELQADKIHIYGAADPEKYPIQPKKHSLEFLREQAHLRFRTNTFSAVFRLRHALAFAIHKYFNDRNFYYIHSPIITSSDAEGAGEIFQVSNLDFQSLAKKDDKAIDFKKDFFGKKTNLTVSGQLEAELAAMAMGKVYTFGPTFRAENSNTSRHAAEFWMVEPEIAFGDLNDNMELAQDFMQYVVKYALDNYPDEIDFLHKRIENIDKLLPKEKRSFLPLKERLQLIIDNDFVRLTYTEAFDILRNSKPNKKKKFNYVLDEWGVDLQSEHERYLVEKKFKKPVIIYDYPAHIKAFYMRNNEDGKTVAAMDVLFPGIGEIIGGSQREERLDVIQKKMKEFNIPEDDMWWYLDLRRFGTAPHSGFGLGFERLVMFVTGMSNIRDVIPFPRTPKNAEF